YYWLYHKTQCHRFHCIPKPTKHRLADGGLLALQLDTQEVVSLTLPLPLVYVLAVSEYSRIVNKDTGACLTNAPGATTDSQGNAVAISCDPNNVLQYWKYYPSKDAIFSIAYGGVKYCLDHGGSTETKAIMDYACVLDSMNDNFKWELYDGYIKRKNRALTPFLTDVSGGGATTQILADPVDLSQLWEFDNR
ncbi:MAG: RICIN domain-containing protein, partial [Oleispira sp.]